LSAVGEVIKSLEANAKDAKDQINAQKDKILTSITEKLEVQAKKLAQDIDNVYGELHGELSKQHGEIKDYLDKVQASVSLPRNLLKRGSIEEILSSQKVIDENIEKLGKEQPENLPPVNDGSIQYVPENIGNIGYDEIVNALGYVGMW
jgi:ClpP class serine protease